MSAGDRPITNGTRPAKFPRASRIPKPRAHDQVAAVCHRMGGQGVEFLLVQTRKARWTFPKGGVEPGLTNAQTAALEAFEEAGVHGRMEEESFARYTRHKRSDLESKGKTKIAVHAYLCEVSRLDPPQQAWRNPTWFSSKKAKQRLRQGRTPEDGTEFARVVDRALTRIRRLHNAPCAPDDALQKVQLEALPEPEVRARVEAALFAYIRRRSEARRPPPELTANGRRCKILQLGPAQDRNPRLLEERTPDYGTDEGRASGTGRKNRRS